MQTRRRRWPVDRVDLLVSAVYGLAALWVTSRLWDGPGNLRTAAVPDDENVFEWFLAHGARWVTHGGNPLFSSQVLRPEGANMMVNTSILGLSVPLAPVTLWLGPHAAFVIAVTLCLWGTAWGWFLVVRRLVSSRLAAFLGAALCGFGPGMIAHAAGQLDLAAEFLVPFLVLLTVRLAAPGRWWARALLLGVLAAYQIMIAEEPLFVTGVTVAVFLGLYAAQRPAEVRPLVGRFLGGLGLAGAVALLLVGYPLWFQFSGPRHATGVMAGAANWITPVDWYVSIPPSSIGGNPTAANTVTSYSEYNEFFGWSLVLVVVLIVAWRWRDPVVRALAGAGLVAGLISLGKTIRYGSYVLGPGPFAGLAHLPLFDKLTPSRFGLAVMVVFGVLIALGLDHWTGLRIQPAAVRRVGAAAVAVALLPLVPTPLMTVEVSPVPAFVTSGAWKAYVGPGQSVVGVPVPMFGHAQAMRWSTATGLDLPLASGYMLGPVGADGSQVDFNPPVRTLAGLLNDAADHGKVPAPLTDEQRQAVLADLRYWRAAIVVARVNDPNAGQIRSLCDALFGPGVQTGGAWVWDVRPLS